MSDSSFKPAAYCGLYCAACPSYMATQRGDCKELGLVECKGCKSDTLTGEWCKDCALKKCAREKGLDFCYECKEYPCESLENFKTDKMYPYHGEVYDYMKSIKKLGKTTWLDEMTKRWNCTNCGKSFDWWTQKCLSCGSETAGYPNPATK